MLNLGRSGERLHDLYDWVDGGTYLAPNRLDVVYGPAFWKGMDRQQMLENRAFEHMVDHEGHTYRQVRPP